MKITERIVMVLIVLALLGGGTWLYVSVQEKEQEVRDKVARGEYEIREDTAVVNTDDWQQYYPELVPIIIGSTTMQASVADSMPERIKGLSETPYLPAHVVKLFAFGVEGDHSIWMKDMNYSIDIIWVAKDGTVTHTEERVSPDSYPNSFSSPKPAWYVIETNAGFVASSSLRVGDKVVVPVP